MKTLIVDDSITARKVVRAFLDSKGSYEMIEAECAETALSILKQNDDFKLVITDINMPGMNGLEFAKEIRNNNLLSHVSIIFMTTEATKEHFTEAIKLGANHFLRKPIHEETFFSTLDKVEYDIKNKKVALTHDEKLYFLNKFESCELKVDIYDEYISINNGKVFLEVPINRAKFFKKIDVEC